MGTPVMGWFSALRLTIFALLGVCKTAVCKVIDAHEIPMKIFPVAKPDVAYDKLFFYDKSLYPGELLIHFHIPKTGGTAFHFLFDKTNCGYRCHGVHNSYSIISKFDRNREKCGFFSQEFSSYTLLKESLRNPNPEAKILVFFRNPMSHVLSAVGHMNRKGIKECKGLERAISGNCSFYNLDNMQTTYFADRDLSAALKHLKSLFWIGITEHYDASICLLSYQLGQFDPSKCNCTGKLVRPMNRGARFTHPLRSISEVRKLTILDLILYEEAYELFLKRVHYAETDLGHPILCENRDGAAALEIKHYLIETEFS